MSVFTDLETLRNHLQAFDFDAIQVNFTPIVLQGIDEAQLPHNALVDGSVHVYTMHENEPVGPVSLTLNGETWLGTGFQAALPESTVVASDTLPLDRYVEGLDYAVLDDSAEIKRLSSSSIGDGETVTAWLLALNTAAATVDYEISVDKGTLSRVADGSLPDPARVFVSYQTTPARASEALLKQAIEDAEGKILARLKPDYDETSKDYGLYLGATELALAYICDDLAGGVLGRHGDSTSDKRAARFIELSRRYEERALNSLTPFIRLPVPSASRRQSNTPPLTW
jgi:hypothetical protein